MDKHIEYIQISNFKSIRVLKLEGLKRINLFIGKPNVGKSNILEAIGLFSLPFIEYSEDKSLVNFIRLENESEMFFHGNFDESAFVKTNQGKYEISLKNTPVLTDTNDRNYNSNEEKLLNIAFSPISGDDYLYIIDEFLNAIRLTNSFSTSNIKKYSFKSPFKQVSSRKSSLVPPLGQNLMSVVEFNKLLKEDISKIFNEYNMQLAFDKASQELKVFKTTSENNIFIVPFNSLADTIQRVIFYKSAISSNENSVLIFEEPEAHAFPPYIVHITQEIIESESNQFIITTHSPYILDYFLENAKDELAIYLVDIKNGETNAKRLSSDEMDEIIRYGVDLFTNYESFLL